MKLGGGIRICKKPSQRRGSFQRWKQLPSAENKSCYLSDKKKAKRAVAEAMKNEAAKVMEEIRNDRNVVFRRMRMIKKKANDLAGNNCIKDENGNIVFAEDGRKRVWKEHMEAIMNEDRMGWNGECRSGLRSHGTICYERSGKSARNHEEWQGQWSNWNCQKAPSCFSTW